MATNGGSRVVNTSLRVVSMTQPLGHGQSRGVVGVRVHLN